MGQDTQSVLEGGPSPPQPWPRGRVLPDWVGYPIFFSILLALAAVAVPNLLRSRMAANESAAIAACKTYCEAQDIYRRTDWDSDGVLEYQQRLSTVIDPGGSCCHLNMTMVDSAFAAAEGDPGTAIPKAGYVFKVLKAQGPHAPGGAKSYVVPGSGVSANSMTLGYALIACPAEYDATGRNTFVVDKSGVVYQKDLGPDTVKLYLSTDAYDPDETWTVAE
ncbi:MAG: DUF2950 domain-containing protein [Planctomycetes bacterium]|nr:DUF2950 domain-containing protein [Planctomycetota bacterium]